jgi:hypothetical protein
MQKGVADAVVSFMLQDLRRFQVWGQVHLQCLHQETAAQRSAVLTGLLGALCADV